MVYSVVYNIFQDLEKNADDENTKYMARYMRDQFCFLGIRSLKRKEMTNPYFKEVKKIKLLLVNNLGQDEFFINKAIGWALRDYSKKLPSRGMVMVQGTINKD